MSDKSVSVNSTPASSPVKKENARGPSHSKGQRPRRSKHIGRFLTIISYAKFKRDASLLKDAYQMVTTKQIWSAGFIEGLALAYMRLGASVPQGLRLPARNKKPKTSTVKTSAAKAAGEPAPETDNAVDKMTDAIAHKAEEAVKHEGLMPDAVGAGSGPAVSTAEADAAAHVVISATSESVAEGPSATTCTALGFPLSPGVIGAWADERAAEERGEDTHDSPSAGP
jgi:hypothetical protein